MTMGLDWTYHAHWFILISHFNFLFVPCGGLGPSAFYCTLNTHYRIVSGMLLSRLSLCNLLYIFLFFSLSVTLYCVNLRLIYLNENFS